MQNKAEAQPAWLQLAAGAGSWGWQLGLAELGNIDKNFLNPQKFLQTASVCLDLFSCL